MNKDRKQIADRWQRRMDLKFKGQKFAYVMFSAKVNKEAAHFSKI